jgi:hypothetical protein
MKNDNVTRFVQCEAECELRTMREVCWCLVSSCQMQLLTLRFDSILGNRVAEIHRMKSENSVYCVTILTSWQTFVQIPPALVTLTDCVSCTKCAPVLSTIFFLNIFHSHKKAGNCRGVTWGRGEGGGQLPPSKYVSYLRIVFFWLPSWTGANKKIGAKVGERGVCILRSDSNQSSPSFKTWTTS